jgi:nucleoside 2-deoxyribosyltransferase
MNIYFACSITGGRKDEATYQSIVTALLADGHSIPTAHISRSDVIALEAIVDPTQIYQRDIGWIEKSDALVAEVSTPSHGVGYEIAYALGRGKPVLCCYLQGTRVSKMLTGNKDPNLHVLAYRDASEVVQIVRDFLREVRYKNQF